ncbi:MAG: hypothetical protein QF535_20765, partial [Anaerolineales bacterium]|nr:hypothetical protein [Anaerolineales bacterium]
GLAKTLNTNNQAIIGEAVTIPSGTSKTFTIAGNMAAAATVKAGEVASFDLVAVNTNATVSGSLPIRGASHTINATLAIGSITTDRGPLDPNAANTKNVGTTGFTFSSLKVTAGSAEKVRLNSIRWNQGSSSASSDLENVMTIVDGTEYSAVISADGKYYVTTFGGGIVLDKGLSKEISIKGDIVGGSGRTIAFTVEKKTDLNVSGELYGYGITPPTSGTGITAGNIWFAGSTVTIANGSMTITQDTNVASDNIALNVVGQPIAAINVDVQGEPISVSSIVFDVATTTGEWGETAYLTDVTLVDQNGSVVAGPVDTSGTGLTITLTDTVNFPIGKNTYTVKGKVGSGVANNGTYQLTTNPATDWTTVTGGTTGNTITPGP